MQMGLLDQIDLVRQGKKYNYLVALWGYSKYVITLNICFACHIRFTHLTTTSTVLWIMALWFYINIKYIWILHAVKPSSVLFQFHVMFTHVF